MFETFKAFPQNKFHWILRCFQWNLPAEHQVNIDDAIGCIRVERNAPVENNVVVRDGLFPLRVRQLSSKNGDRQLRERGCWENGMQEAN